MSALSALPVELGVIEAYYGRPWSWRDRAAVVTRLAPSGYRFYVYAPKAETALRRAWREPLPKALATDLAACAQHCRALGVRFGVGISPVGFDDAPGSSDWAALVRLLAQLDEQVAPTELAILFDDIRGDDPQLADRQAAVVARVAERSGAARLTVCPSYYSDDPVLDRVFGVRPSGYLARLGQLLDPSVGVFWTGEEVCSREISPAHLRAVAEQLRRPPVLWDNYPVNDGQRMSQYLHLRAFTGRPASNAPYLAAHAVNPALQPTLGCIPLLTLAERYRVGDDGYAYGAAFARAASVVLDEPTLAAALRDDLILLQDTGLDRLGERAEALCVRYAAFNHPAAHEVLAWLEGAWRITHEMVQTQ